MIETFTENSIDRECEDLTREFDSSFQFIRRNNPSEGAKGSITVDVPGQATRTIAELTRTNTKGIWEMDTNNIVAKQIMKYWIE